MRSVLNFDHTVVAVHSDASVWLLPYVTDLDAHCQWVSQWRRLCAHSGRMRSRAFVVFESYLDMSQQAHLEANKIPFLGGGSYL